VITLSKGLPTAADQCPPAGGRAFSLEGDRRFESLVPFPPAQGAGSGRNRAPTTSQRRDRLARDDFAMILDELSWENSSRECAINS